MTTPQITETDNFDSGVYQYQTTDQALGGPTGVMNTPLGNLTNRTRYLFNRISEILGTSKVYALAGGSANAITAAYSPVIAALTDGMTLKFKGGYANTGATTFTPNTAATGGIAPAPIYGQDLQPLSGGEVVVNGNCAIQWNAALNSGNGAWVLLENSGGIRKAITPAQFDNSPKSATTAFVQAALGNFNQLYGAATGTIPASQVGAINIQIATGATNQVLPLTTAVPRGSRQDFVNSTSVNMTLTCQGSDNFILLGSTYASVVLQPGEALTVASNASGAWYGVGGNAMNRYCAQFTASLSGSGYQKFPGGLIMQWGPATTNSSGIATFTLPIAFPNAILSANCSYFVNVAIANICALYSATYSTTQVAGIVVNTSGVGQSGAQIRFVAFGY